MMKCLWQMSMANACLHGEINLRVAICNKFRRLRYPGRIFTFCTLGTNGLNQSIKRLTFWVRKYRCLFNNLRCASTQVGEHWALSNWVCRLHFLDVLQIDYNHCTCSPKSNKAFIKCSEIFKMAGIEFWQATWAYKVEEWLLSSVGVNSSWGSTIFKVKSTRLTINIIFWEL